jgi:hypothetical protein
VDRGVSAEHVIVGKEMSKAQLFDPLSVSTDGAGVGADLGLREHDT